MYKLIYHKSPRLFRFATLIVVLISIVLFTNLHVYFFANPQGIHVARQTDSYAFSLYYYLTGNDLFHPGNLNLESVKGQCASEFPIVYFITAFLYKYFGFSYLFLKTISFSFLIVAFLYTYRIIRLLRGSFYQGLVFTILFFSSTVLLYYSTLSLPEVVAMSLCIVSLYYAIKWNNSKANGSILMFYVLMTIASLLKASFFYYVIAFLIYSVLTEHFFQKSTLNRLFYFLISVIVIASWYGYARNYNLINLDFYYTVKPRPFWEATHEQNLKALNAILNYWYSKYYFYSTFHLFYLIVVTFLIFGKKKSKELFAIGLVILFSSLYVALFFPQFKDHDYYFIVIIPTIILVITICFIRVDERINVKWLRFGMNVIIFVIALSSINYAKLNLYRRYTSIDSYSNIYPQLKSVEHFLDSLSIPKDAKFTVIGDRTRNGSLVLLKRFGWTYSNFGIRQDHVMSSIQKSDCVLILRPSQNMIPSELKSHFDGFNKYTFYSSHLYLRNKTVQ